MLQFIFIFFPSSFVLIKFRFFYFIFFFGAFLLLYFDSFRKVFIHIPLPIDQNMIKRRKMEENKPQGYSNIHALIILLLFVIVNRKDMKQFSFFFQFRGFLSFLHLFFINFLFGLVTLFISPKNAFEIISIAWPQCNAEEGRSKRKKIRNKIRKSSRWPRPNTGPTELIEQEMRAKQSKNYAKFQCTFSQVLAPFFLSLWHTHTNGTRKNVLY